MDPNAPLHPGRYIKQQVLPSGVSVTKAAELLGVGRPALSNLLNGKAALTQEMAARIEKTFGAKATELMTLQIAYEAFHNRDQAKEVAVRTYVPAFLGITARQISAWAGGSIAARSELPALLRRLVHSTGASLQKVDFPAFDNSQRHGWDGTVSSDAATPWIPRGESGWEFGCDQTPARKAEDDYAARTASTEAERRATMILIFVTPHNWPGKEMWAANKRKEKTWKDVRAYDASDLEQWLEQSIPAQAWFCERIGNGADGLISPDKCWSDWASASDPPLSKILFRAAVTAAKNKLQDWLGKQPIAPFVVTADSEGEALAFLACAFEEIGKPSGAYRDRALVIKTVEALNRTTTLSSDFVVIVSTPEVEVASASIRTTHHVIVVRRRNEVSDGPDIALDLVDDQTYREALSEMGLHQPDYERYSRETANSPTILRRRLSKFPAIKTPAWASDRSLARQLIPLNFVGSWDSETKADRDIVSILADADFSSIEEAVNQLRVVEDAPIWSVGRFRGVVSKIDVLFATHSLITKQDLDWFFLVAQTVLSEADPALDLPEDKQWMANIYGKTREHSAGLRRGICETLVLLAAHGNDLLRERLGIDVPARVDAVVRSLLLPLEGRTWSSHRSDLPQYAEAAPDVFLDVLEQDLRSPEPKVYALMQPANSGPFGGGCPRTGLLWALETLAWKPERLLRVSMLLATLAEIELKDNWMNKPGASLGAIYRSWMPQTAASIAERNAAMEAICRKHPRVGWQLITSQFGDHHAIGTYSARPHWRNDAAGAGQTAKTYGEIYEVADRARELALSWPKHDQHTLGDLLDRLHDMTEADRERVWTLIDEFAASDASDKARHELRERVRKTAFTRRARIRGTPPAVKDRARDAYLFLAPRDLIVRHLWLFERHWVDPSSDEWEEEGFDFKTRDARITQERKIALTEIWQKLGYDGLMRLCELGGAESAIGSLLVDVIGESDRNALLDRLVKQGPSPAPLKIDNLISGFLFRLEASSRQSMISHGLKEYLHCGSVNEAIRLLKCAPFKSETWSYLEQLPAEWQQRYWKEAYVRWEGQEEAEFNTLVHRLIEAGRAPEALHVVHIDFEKVETKLLARLLRSVANSPVAPGGSLHIEQYDIAQAFKSLQKRADVDKNDLAQLEFACITALEHSDYGIPTLQEMLGEEPQLFMQMIALVYRRKDGGQDPPEWTLADEEHRRSAGTMAYRILHHMSRIPGTNHKGEINPANLRAWIDGVRALGAAHGRDTTTDTVIGELLGRCGPDPDGVWPCQPVRQALDAIASPEMARGMSIGRYNTRGVHFRGPSGDEERALAAKYRGWASAVEIECPFTARMLSEIAQGYDREAVYHDTEENVRKRLNY